MRDKTKADFEAMANGLFPFAQEMVRKTGSFLPFGGFINPSGQFEMYAAYNGEEHPEPSAIVALLTEGFREGVADRRMRAFGACVDVRTIPPGSTEKCDAVMLSMEHSDGIGINGFLPYRKRMFRGYEFLDPFYERVETRIFPPETSAV
jgi:hypothetical protein